MEEKEFEKVKIGDLELHSTALTINQLIELAVLMLKEKPVKDYLHSLKNTKIKTGGYFG